MFSEKNLFFAFFHCSTKKKFKRPPIGQFFKIDALHISHFEAYVPNFSKHLWNLTIPQKLWVSKLDDPGPLPPKLVFLDHFLDALASLAFKLSLSE